jgi:PPOX class probable F420-dependent enzyme
MPMSRSELDEFLEAPRLAHFATIGSDGSPRVRPVWYVWADGLLHFTTRMHARRTGADVAAGSSVAVSVASEDHPYRAVLARGRMEIEEEGRDAWLERIARRYGVYPEWYQDALGEDDRVVMRLELQTLVTWDYGKGDYAALNAGASFRTTL